MSNGTHVLGAGDYASLQTAFQQSQVAAQQQLNSSLGFKRSAKLTGTVASGAGVGEIEDFVLPYGFLVLRIPNCTGIAASTSLRMQLGMTGADTLCLVYDMVLQSTNLATVPTSGTFQIVIPQAMGFQRAQLVLSVNTTGAVAYEMYACDLLSA